MTKGCEDRKTKLKNQSEILPGLFHGMRPGTYVGFDLVVSCEEFLAKRPMENYQGVTVHLPMRDEDDFVPSYGSVADVALMVRNFVTQGKKVLVHCTGGLNRSGLVTVRAIQALTDCSPKEALAVLRRAHDPWAVCNIAFERWLTGEVLPTAETSAFRFEVAKTEIVCGHCGADVWWSLPRGTDPCAECGKPIGRTSEQLPTAATTKGGEVDG